MGKQGRFSPLVNETICPSSATSRRPSVNDLCARSRHLRSELRHIFISQYINYLCVAKCHPTATAEHLLSKADAKSAISWPRFEYPDANFQMHCGLRRPRSVGVTVPTILRSLLPMKTPQFRIF